MGQSRTKQGVKHRDRAPPVRDGTALRDTACTPRDAAHIKDPSWPPQLCSQLGSLCDPPTPDSFCTSPNLPWNVPYSKAEFHPCSSRLEWTGAARSQECARQDVSQRVHEGAQGEERKGNLILLHLQNVPSTSPAGTTGLKCCSETGQDRRWNSRAQEREKCSQG